MEASAVSVPWLLPGEMSAGGEEGGGGGEGREEDEEKADQGGGRMSWTRIHFVRGRENELERGMKEAKCGLLENVRHYDSFEISVEKLIRYAGSICCASLIV